MGQLQTYDSWRYETIRITKYDPKFRDTSGAYKKHDWTSFSEVDKFFNGEKLTIESYLNIEEKYAESVVKFFQFHDCHSVRIINLSTFENEDNRFENLLAPKSLLKSLKEGSTVTLPEAKIVAKLILRGILWAELFSVDSDEVAVRFGYDFYMYFNSSSKLDRLLDWVRQEGLFVD